MLNNVAIVTGGSSGIGMEFARQLADKGYNLLLVSNQEKELQLAKDEILVLNPGVECLTFYSDLTEADAPGKILEFCHQNELTVEILVNDAGIFCMKEMTALGKGRLDLYIDLHVRAVTHLSVLFGREMAQRKHGYILNMSSMSCWMPMPGIGMYSATKAYIRVFSRTLNLELKESGVAVMVACPGGIATDLFGLPVKLQRLGVRLGVLATPKSFVKGALKRLFKRKAQYINGWLNRIAIVFVAVLPSRMRLIVKHKLLDNKND